MTRAIRLLLMLTVALLTEGVDRNKELPGFLDKKPEVALLAEGVDRNVMNDCSLLGTICRPPRGGRG